MIQIIALLLAVAGLVNARPVIISGGDDAALGQTLGQTTRGMERTDTPRPLSPRHPLNSPSPRHPTSSLSPRRPTSSPSPRVTSPHNHVKSPPLVKKSPWKKPPSSPVSHHAMKSPRSPEHARSPSKPVHTYVMMDFKGLSIPKGTGCPPEVFFTHPASSIFTTEPKRDTSPSSKNSSSSPSHPSPSPSPRLARSGEALNAPAAGPDIEPKTGSAAVPVHFVSFLALHNRIRVKHQAGPVNWDSDLEEDARHWITSLPCGVVDHGKSETEGSAGNLYQGENLYARGTKRSNSSDLQATIDEALTFWYEMEEPNYNYNMPHFSENTGHFTQVVWKGSKRIGCAITPTSCRKDKHYWHTMACRYSPAGNVDGAFQNNVFPVK